MSCTAASARCPLPACRCVPQQPRVAAAARRGQGRPSALLMPAKVQLMVAYRSTDVLPLVAYQVCASEEEPTTMAEFQIEREVVIDAPVAIVWRTITEPEQIRQWFADRVELELEPGGRGLMGFEDRAFPLVVEALEPP